jgi:hypothetical protein
MRNIEIVVALLIAFTWVRNGTEVDWIKLAAIGVIAVWLEGVGGGK